MKKKEKHSVAIIIWNKNRDKVLLVQRPLDDDSLPGHWGFPAASKKDLNDKWELYSHKAAETKLGVKVKIIKLLGEDTVDRGKFILRLRDYEVEIIDGEPSVHQPIKGVTQYIKMEYTDDLRRIIESAKNKSLCTRIFLNSIGVDYKNPKRHKIKDS